MEYRFAQLMDAVRHFETEISMLLARDGEAAFDALGVLAVRLEVPSAMKKLGPGARACPP